MEDTAKYLIHADFVADGVVERNDVVGAAFGQTEGLLGDDLDIRGLQDSAKLGRIDVSVESENGQSFGHIAVASSLDRVETATLAAALEAVERIGPCRADVEVQRIEDVRAAKRREVVDRATELLASGFDEGAMAPEDILQTVRERVRVEDVTEYEGLPAGPNVASSDAVVVVEGRADVVNLLGYGIKNAVAVEGTNVPDAVADLTHGRTVTAFLDGDRGGDLIRRELEQVADLDYVARAPSGAAVEDLSRQAVDAALREKTPAGDVDSLRDVPVDALPADAQDAADADSPRDGETPSGDADPTGDATAATDGSATPAPAGGDGRAATETPDAPAGSEQSGTAEPSEGASAAGDESSPGSEAESRGEAPQSMADHVDAVADAGTTRLLDADLSVASEGPADEAFDALEAASQVPKAVVVDDTVTQRLLDLAAQRGVATLVGRDSGEFVKQPVGVRVHEFEDF